MTDNLLGIDLAAHKKAVLSGGLKGRTLRDAVRVAVTHPDALSTLKNLIFVHRFLLWHLVFSPDTEDRTALESEGITETFEARLKTGIPQSDPTDFSLSHEALPGSKKLNRFTATSDCWFARMFPPASIHWEQTWHHFGLPNLQHTFMCLTMLGFPQVARVSDLASFTEFGRLFGSQKKEQETDFDFLMRRCAEAKCSKEAFRLVLEGTVPAYFTFRLGEAELENSLKVWDHMRLALASRSRYITDTAVFDEVSRDVLNSLPREDGHIYPNTKDNHEMVIAFPDNSMFGIKGMRAVFVKNQWVIGYATAAQAFFDRPDIISGGVHIFKEFRGTPTSSMLFNLYMASLADLDRMTYFIIDRSRSSDRDQEDEERLTAFYLRHGFRWITETLMTRAFPRF